MKGLLYVVLPAALLVAAIFFTLQGLQAPPEPVAPAAEQPRYAVTGAQWLRLGVTGEPEFRAEAATIDYYADGTARLRAIGMDALGGFDSPWHVRAPQGEAPPRARRCTGGWACRPSRSARSANGWCSCSTW